MTYIITRLHGGRVDSYVRHIAEDGTRYTATPLRDEALTWPDLTSAVAAVQRLPVDEYDLSVMPK